MIKDLDTAIWLARMADPDERRAARLIYGGPTPPRRRDEGGCQPDWLKGRPTASKPRTVWAEGLEYRLAERRSNALFPKLPIV